MIKRLNISAQVSNDPVKYLAELVTGGEILNNEVVVELRNIRKEFPGVVALDGVNMDIRAGCIHALLGENGAGKSTLMKILSGTYKNYDGEVIYQGREVHLKSEKDAIDLGIAIVSQELNFVPELTIAENLYLGREPKVHGFVDKKKRAEDSAYWLSFMGLDYGQDTKMGDLSVAQRQMIEILKAVSRNGKVLIMDEPTSALTGMETAILFDKIRELKEKGIAFVFISHRLDEVFELCDDYTVLRDGQYIGSGRLTDIDQDQMISMMVGREVQEIYPPLTSAAGRTVLEVKNLNSEGVFENISFTLHAGEILGFAGMMGAGRSEIARAIFGMDRYDSGEIRIDGEPCQIRDIRDAVNHGIAMVTEDRAEYGFVGVRSIRENVVLANEDLFTRHGILDGPKIQKNVTDIYERLDIKAPGIDTLVGTLSGGNQQKLVLGKWLVRDVSVLILDEPTRGIDVGARQEIYRLIVELAAQGMAILLISSDMPEVLSMSHRIMVIANGKCAGELSSKEATQDLIMKKIVEVDRNYERHSAENEA
ncbi:MAG: sugar ABC transporter ATP-binding protein [Lachnospiraceae bacterium]|nr:sugar ABC transporter ATP-binding protein [Lachnospiraceae bacterium]